jgi:hypothetical protein
MRCARMELDLVSFMVRALVIYSWCSVDSQGEGEERGDE